MSDVNEVEALEAIVGTRPLAVLMKSIDALDGHCERLLQAAPVGVLGYCDRAGRARAVAIGGRPGFASVVDPTHLHLPQVDPAELDETVGVSTLFLIPGLGETLRINGRPRRTDHGLEVVVEEAFAHCAKAILRSSLWEAPGPRPSARLAPGAGPLSRPDVVELLSCTPFVVLTSWSASGAADASPKGDPPGFIALDDRGRVVIADRPGNRRTDTFHNVLEQPRVALVAFLPGDDRLLELSGRASLSADPALLAKLAVQNKTPKIALLLDVDDARVVVSAAVRDTALWDPARHVPASALPRMADVFIDHVKQNKEKGLGARAIRTLATKTMMRWGLEQDYTKNRY